MKPLKLTVEGWMAYRDKTEIEFPDDVFLIAGDTGSGKSALLEAMTFCLFGETPRLGAKGVGNLITQGEAAAIVQLEFESAGNRYRVTRSLKLQGEDRRLRQSLILEVWTEDDPEMGGAVSGIAGWEGIADRVREAEARLKELVGLSYDAFTRAAVLPQGKFAEMLTGAADRRRAVLTEILDLGRYTEVGRLARSRGQDRGKELGALDLNLERAGDVAGDLTAAQKLQVDSLLWQGRLIIAHHESAKYFATVALAEEAVLMWDTGWIKPAHDAAVEYAGAADAAAENLRELEDQLEPLEEAWVTFFEQAQTRRRETDEADAGYTKCVEANNETTAPSTLDEAERHLQTLATASESIEDLESRVGEMEGELQMASQILLSQRQDNLAAAVRQAMGPDESWVCPVCGNIYEPAKAPAGADEGSGTLQEHESAENHARGELESARLALQAARTGAEAAERGIEALIPAFGGTRPAAPQIEAIRADSLSRSTAVAEAFEAKKVARQAVQLADREAEVAKTQVDTLRVGLEAAREFKPVPPSADAVHAAVARADITMTTLGELGIPALSVAVLDWDALKPLATHFGMHASTATVTIGELKKVIQPRDPAELSDAAEDAGAEAAAAGARIEILQQQLTQREEDEATRLALQAEVDALDRVAKALEADEFLDFVQRETLDGIVAAAGEHLRELTDGRYELLMSGPGDIGVADEWAGGEVRPAQTLSGGESFVASIAMGLAVAEEAQRQAGASHRLGCLFIDEGFGTLDAETLAVVGDSLAALRAGGRTVGIISHVPELADVVGRVFRVTKGPAGSTITEV